MSEKLSQFLALGQRLFQMNIGGAETKVCSGARIRRFSPEPELDSIKEAEKATPFLEYTTPDYQNIYVPNSEQQTFHLNLWQFNYNGGQPAPSPTSVIVTNFQYDPI